MAQAESAAAAGWAAAAVVMPGFRTLLVLGANLMAFGVLWVVKFLVFNRLFHVSPVSEDAELVEVSP